MSKKTTQHVTSDYKNSTSSVFLGKTVSSDTRSLHEIKIRIAAAKLAFTDKILITNKFLLRQDRVLDAYITPVLMHGSEVQTFFLKKCKNHQCSRNVVHQTD